jgi:hypothetical protein
MGEHVGHVPFRPFGAGQKSQYRSRYHGVPSPSKRHLAALVIAMLCASSVARAHPEWSPLRVNRYTKIVLADAGKLMLVYTLLYGEGPGLAVRKSADVDANGHIDERERSALGALAQAAVRNGLKLTLDGAPIAPALDGVDVGLAGDDVAPDPLSIDVRYHIDARAGAMHELVIDDRVEVPNEGDTEIVVEVQGPTELRAAFHGSAPTKAAAPRDPLFTFRGPRFSALEDRRVTLRFLAPASTVAPHRALFARRDLWSVLAGVTAALAMALLLRRRQRRLNG